MTAIQTERTARDLLLAYIERFVAGDVEGTIALFHDQALVEIPLLPERAYGPSAVRNAVTGAVTSVTDVKITLNELVATPAIALADGEFFGTSTGELPNLDFGFGLVVEARDGLITRLTEYFDTDPILPLNN